jgi:manganese/iron transport system substrate-binding protein
MRSTLTAIALCLTASPALAQDFKVVTSFTVLADMARAVGGELVTVASITKPGAEIHGYEPTPRDLVGAMDADLILWNGLNLELWFEQFLSNLGDVPAVVVSDGITPLPIRTGSYEGKPNPHAWMSLSAAMIYVDNIAAAFSKADPDNAATYAQNAQDYKALLTQTIAPLRDKVQAIPEDQRWLVSCEGAFSYLAQDLGLREAYLWPINADETGTPQQVRAVIDTVRENNIPAVFCESTVNNDPAQQVARETGARFGGVLYVDSLSAEDGPVPSFVDLLRVSTQTVVDGLTGP